MNHFWMNHFKLKFSIDSAVSVEDILNRLSLFKAHRLSFLIELVTVLNC